MANRKRLYKTEDVLEALFALPSDVEDSEDDLEVSDDQDCGTDGGAGVAGSTVVDSVSENDDDSMLSDCSSTLYMLASDSDESPCSSDSEDALESDPPSDDEEVGWKKRAMNDVDIDFDVVHVIPANPFLPSDGAAEFFCKFFDDDLFHLLLTQTNLYAAQQRIRHWHDVTKNEMKAFLGILVAMGCHQVPSLEMFWSSDPLFRIEPIASIMTRVRFRKILQALHVNDNSQAPSRDDVMFDKLHKLRPMIDMLNNGFQKQSIASTSQSIDEAMVLFKGRSGIKQYMPLKPTKRGYKIWVRSDSRTGYVYQFQVYTGKEQDVSGTGLGGRVVKYLCQSLKQKNVHVTFDNFFTSYTLLEDLYKDGIYCTATVRPNRTDLPVVARQRTDMDRGEMKWRTKDHTGYVQWQDTKVVHVLSTAYTPTNVDKTNRKLKDGSVVQIPCPKPVKQYTGRMGGVDRFDQKRCYYSVSRRSRRWWLRLFYFLVDTCIVNAHILHTSVHPDDCLSQLQFRVNLFRGLVCNYSSKARRTSLQMNFVRRRRHKADKKPTGVPDNIRTCSVGLHMPAELPSFRRCRLCSTKAHNRRSRIQCSTCHVPLCVVPCFAKFHQ